MNTGIAYDIAERGKKMRINDEYDPSGTDFGSCGGSTSGKTLLTVCRSCGGRPSNGRIREACKHYNTGGLQ